MLRSLYAGLMLGALAVLASGYQVQKADMNQCNPNEPNVNTPPQFQFDQPPMAPAPAPGCPLVNPGPPNNGNVPYQLADRDDDRYYYDDHDRFPRWRCRPDGFCYREWGWDDRERHEEHEHEHVFLPVTPEL